MSLLAQTGSLWEAHPYPVSRLVYTLLFMIFYGPVPFLPQLFGLGMGALLAGGVRTPRQVLLRLRVWWIDRRLRSRRLRVVRGEEDLPGQGRSGSDKYLH